MRTRRRVVFLATVLSATIANVHAATPPEVSGFFASVHTGDNAMFVGGEVTFTGEDPQVLGLDPQGDAERPEPGLFGMDVRAIAVWQPNATDQTLWLALSFWDFQANAPEIASYRWTFTIDGTPYRLEAALGGHTMDGSMDSPSLQGDELDLDGTFRLLGPCRVPERWPWEDVDCPYLQTVTGEFDLNTDRVLWRMPIDGLFGPGRVIGPHPLGGEAEIRVGTVRFTDRVQQDRPGHQTYTISSARVMLGTAPADDPSTITYTTEAMLSPDPREPGRYSFQGTVDITHLDHGTPGPNRYYEAVALPCSASNCGQAARAPFAL